MVGTPISAMWWAWALREPPGQFSPLPRRALAWVFEDLGAGRAQKRVRADFWDRAQDGLSRIWSFWLMCWLATARAAVRLSLRAVSHELMGVSGESSQADARSLRLEVLS